MGARGFSVLKKLRKLKMKTRQYDTDEAGDYGDAVPVLLEILHNSGFGYSYCDPYFNIEHRHLWNKF